LPIQMLSIRHNLKTKTNQIDFHSEMPNLLKHHKKNSLTVKTSPTNNKRKMYLSIIRFFSVLNK
jgi:hypothetical protein